MAKKLIDTDIKLGKGTLLLEALEDLGIDFPVEQEFGNAQYTKWHSGRLTQVIRYDAQLTSGNNSVYVPLPIDAVGPGNAVAGIRSNTSIAYNRITVHRAMARTSDVNVGINAETNTLARIIVFFEGRWK